MFTHTHTEKNVKTTYDQQILKYLLSVPLKNKLTDRWSRGRYPKNDGERHTGRDLLRVPWEGPETTPFTKALRKTTSKGSAVVLCKTGIAKEDETTEIP